MKRFIIFIILILSVFALASAQNNAGYSVKDSLVFKKAPILDSTLKGKSIFNLLDSGQSSAEVKIRQSQAIVDAFKRHIRSNSNRTMQGYRVRIFFDNQQNSRSESEATVESFRAKHPGIAAYRNFQSPFFKVTVGDFRTKSEAVELLNRIKSDFPSAFIVKENINYPIVDRYNAYVIDTVRVIKKL